ncbi:MAG: biopolymer transporter ExbD [Brachymonas sp.]|nr:biopolymer transporter ExbD [Brachymonas sp.]
MSFGRLERRKGSEPMSEINVTPLVDVMLVLLVIFIITAPLLASSIKLDLPSSEAAKLMDSPKFVTVVIDKSAQVFLDDQAVDLKALAERLKQSAERSKETEVQLRSDETVPYGKVVEVIGIAQKAGLTRIGFVANPQAPATKP